jgi:magnesium transporter
MEIEKNKHVQWIDIQKPTAKDLTWLKEKLKLHPVVVDELRGPSARARVDQYDTYLYFIYYFPLYDVKDAASVRTEIDFIITKDAVVTIHYEPLTGVLEDFDIGAATSSLKLMYNIIQHLLNFQERQLRHVREKVESIGREIFRDKEREVLEKITHSKRDVSEYRIVVRLQEPILKSLIAKGKIFWADTNINPGKAHNAADVEIYLNDLLGDHMKIMNQIEDYRDAVGDFEDTNNQLMSLKINGVMKTFTLLSFLTFPFVLFVSLFSIRTPDTPLVNDPHGFWIIVGVVAIGMIVLGVYFKQKKWF